MDLDVNADFDTSHLQPLAPPMGPQPEPPPSSTPDSPEPVIDQRMLFIDTVAKEFELGTAHVSHLRALYHLGTAFEGSLSKADLYTRLFALACQFSMERRIMLTIQSATTNSFSGAGDFKKILEELSIRLDTNFSLTSEQTLTVRRTCQELIYQPRRVSFKNLYSEVDKFVRQNSTSFRMDNVFAVPAREGKWMADVKRIASSVRNSFRQDLRNSVIGPNQMSLDKFTTDSTVKYHHTSQARNSPQGYIVHNVILRRFCIEHQSLLGVNAQDLEDSESSVEYNDIEPPSQLKRKRVAKGRIAEGADFWSKVDAWFKDAMKARGDNFTGEAWRAYVDESIRLDNAHHESFLLARAQARMPRITPTAHRISNSGSHAPSPSPAELRPSPSSSSSSSSIMPPSVPGFLEGFLQTSLQPGSFVNTFMS